MKDDSAIAGIVWDCVEHAMWNSAQRVVYHSVCNSAGYSLRESILDSIRISERKSYWDSVWSSIELPINPHVKDYFKQNER
jgi:hypothetical protein